MNENERLANIGHRRCSKCLQAKPVEQFHAKGKGRRRNQCNVCRNEGAARAWRAQADPELVARRQAREERRALALGGWRKCSACGETKSITDFENRGERKSKDGTPRFNVSSKCNACLGRDEDRIARARENRVLALKGEKRCKRCDQIKPTTEFYAARPGQFQAQCKTCWNLDS